MSNRMLLLPRLLDGKALRSPTTLRASFLRLTDRPLQVPATQFCGKEQHYLLLQQARDLSSATSICYELSKTRAAIPSTGHNMEWRKKQLDLLEQKFHPHKAASKTAASLDDESDDESDDSSRKDTATTTTTSIQHDDDLQPMWREMESRVKNRRMRSVEENQGRIGRQNIKKTDEEEWLRAGLYSDKGEKDQADR